MRNLNYDPSEEGIQSALYEEASAQDRAYSLLRKGLAHFDETEEVLDATALAAIRPFREKLVLSSRERWLLEQSQERHQKEKDRRRSRAVIIALPVLVLLLILFLQPGRSPERGEPVKKALEKPSAVPVAQTSVEGKAASSAKEARLKQVEARPVDPASEPDPPQDEAAPEVDPRSNFSMVISVQTQSGEVWRVRKAGKWGLATPEGKVLLPLTYRRVRVLQAEQGYFILEDGQQRGIADASGQVLLPPVYDDLGEYYEQAGLLIVKNKDKSGVFDLRKNKMIIKPEFQAIRHFSEGLLGIQSPAGKWGFADINGRIIIAPAYDAIVEPFREGRALVASDTNQYYIDREGAVMASRQ